MSGLALTNANIPYPDFVLHTVIDPDKFDLNNAELQGKLNATITQVNLNTPEIALKANKTYVDTQDASLQSQLNSQSSQIALKANSADVYTKSEVDTSLNGKADKTTTYTKTEVDSALSLKANSSDVTAQLATKANASTTYSKTEVDSLLSPKATTAYVDTQLSSKANTIDVYSKATLNDTGTSSGATLIGSQAISGVTGTTVRAQIVSLKSQIDTISAGTIPDGSITPAKLDRAYLQLTGGTLSGLLTGTTINATTLQEGGTNLSSKYAQLSGATFTGTVNAPILQENGVALSSRYLPVSGGTLTGNTTLTKAGAQAIFDIGSTTDDTRIRILTSGAKSFIQSGNVAGAGKDLELAGWNANNIPVLTLRATSTIATGTITGTTINASTALQEGGTSLSSKYLQLVGGTITGQVTHNSTTVLNNDTYLRKPTFRQWALFQASADDYRILPSTTIDASDWNTANQFTFTASTGNFNAKTITEGGVALSSKYAPIASPTFTGTVTAPTLTAPTINGGTINGPITATGTVTHNTDTYYKRAGVRQWAVYQNGDALTFLPSTTVDTNDWNTANDVTITASTGNLDAKTISENGTALSSKYLTLVGGTLTGQLTVNRDGSVMSCRSTVTGDPALAYIEFKDSALTRYGYVGKGGNSKQTMLRSDLGDINLETPNGITMTSGLRNNDGYFEVGIFSTSGHGTDRKMQSYFSNGTGTPTWNIGGRIISTNAAVATDIDVSGKVRSAGTILTSTREMKKNIESYTDNALQEVLTTPVRKYHYNYELDTELKHVGMIVDELPAYAVDIQGKGVDMYGLVAILWKSVQELHAEVELLKNR